MCLCLTLNVSSLWNCDDAERHDIIIWCFRFLFWCMHCSGWLAFFWRVASSNPTRLLPAITGTVGWREAAEKNDVRDFRSVSVSIFLCLCLCLCLSLSLCLTVCLCLSVCLFVCLSLSEKKEESLRICAVVLSFLTWLYCVHIYVLNSYKQMCQICVL